MLCKPSGAVAACRGALQSQVAARPECLSALPARFARRFLGGPPEQANWHVQVSDRKYHGAGLPVLHLLLRFIACPLISPLSRRGRPALFNVHSGCVSSPTSHYSSRCENLEYAEGHRAHPPDPPEFRRRQTGDLNGSLTRAQRCVPDPSNPTSERGFVRALAPPAISLASADTAAH